MTPVIGVVVCFAGSYIPRDWASCDGQTLLISQNPLLFKILGATYGGDGVTKFCLPDLRGRTAVSAGQSPFRNYKPGDAAGSKSVTLGVHQIPAHTHSVNMELHLGASQDPAIDSTVNNNYPAECDNAYVTAPKTDTYMFPPDYDVIIGNAGSGVPINTRSPFLGIRYIICLQGIFPPRP